MKQCQRELIDHNVLYSEILREIRTCDMDLIEQIFPFVEPFVRKLRWETTHVFRMS